LEDRRVEVKQEASVYAAQSHIRQDLRLMDRHQSLNGFQLQDESAFDDDIDPIPAIQPHRFVDHRQGYLTFKVYPSPTQLKTEAFLVRGLQQSGTKMAVNLDGEANNLVRQDVPLVRHRHCRRHLAVSLPRCENFTRS